MAWEKQSVQVASVTNPSEARWAIQIVLHNDLDYDQSFILNVNQVDQPNDDQITSLISAFVDQQNLAADAQARQQAMQDNMVVAYALTPENKDVIIGVIKSLSGIAVQVDHDGYSEEIL